MHRYLILFFMTFIFAVGKGFSSDRISSESEGSPLVSESKKANLLIEGKKYALPTFKAKDGTWVVEVTSKVLKDEVIFLDNGSRCSTFLPPSSISDIGPSPAALEYQGMSIEKLMGYSFSDVFHLLLYNKIPSSQSCLVCPPFDVESVEHHLKRPKKIKGSPMEELQSLIPRMDEFFEKPKDPTHEHYMGCMITLFGIVFASETGCKPIQPRPALSPSENLLYIILGDQYEKKETDRKQFSKIKSILEKLMILHMDHGYNLSTTTALVVQSGGASIPAILSAAVGALSGPKHGGASIAAFKQLEMIQMSKDPKKEIKRIITEATKPDKPRISGIGHREYKDKDPRAGIIEKLLEKLYQKEADESEDRIGKDASGKDKEAFDSAESKDSEEDCKMGEVSEDSQMVSPLYEIAKQLEKKIAKTEYFVERNLYPNLDFYSGILLDRIGIPPSLFPVFFAVTRTAGWLAHIKECKGKLDIVRPPEIRL